MVDKEITGLQSRVPRFDSGSRLQIAHLISIYCDTYVIWSYLHLSLLATIHCGVSVANYPQIDKS